ncbi:multicopper oxidase domain-containing protein [Streptomyces sp. NPDC047886]|uniref:multicopper oxidase domain-containing protein n=1 Tax=Streptomyces sp. NPDC047886 TaxID=3365490 RepID=UPI0037121A1F
MPSLSPPSAPSANPPGPPLFRVRHLRGHIVVVGWLAAALLTAVAEPVLPVARWLSLHMFLLGAVTNAIVVWSEHFTVALLHAPQPDVRWSDVRLVGLNVSVVAVLVGTGGGPAALTAVGAAGVTAAVLAHLVALSRIGRRSLGGRLALLTGYYRSAAGALAVGAVLGGLLGTGWAAHRHTEVMLAHVHVNLLGWVGLPVVGTLFMLWPTVLGLRMEDRTARVARRVLRLLLPGLALAVAGLLAGARWPAAAGLALYAAGLADAAVLFVATVRRRAPRSPAAWMLAAATGWFVLAVLADLVLLATRPLDRLHDDLDPLLQVLLIGFVGQVLLGALTHLLPMVLSRGPAGRDAVRSVLERAWRVRVAALNLAVPLVALPLPDPAATAGRLLAGASVAWFVVLGASLVGGPHTGPGASPGRRAPLLGGAAGVAVTVLALLVATTSGGGAPAADGHHTDTAASGTRTVDVKLSGMRVIPDTVTVPAGTRLVLNVTNSDTMRHDLRVQSGPGTPLLGRGESARLDLGRITGERSAWCTVPGHRAAGMTMLITVESGTADTAAGTGTGGTGHGDHTAAGSGKGPGLNLAADFSPGFAPRAAALPPAGAARVHKVRLRAVERDVEVAPGVRQRMWTFGGTAPGPVLRGKVGDVFEVTLVNDTGMGHGIDFHAGALAPDRPMRTIGPGEELVYRFTAERAGAWLYHCSTAPMLQHMGNGMYGAVVIDPPDLPAVDREYLLVSSQLYLGEPGSEGQVAKMRDNRPDAWAFNGVAAQYAKAPLTAKAGERARFWVVAAGPSDGIAFHVVGTVFDTVYKEGAYLLRPDDPGGAQVLDLAAAQGGFVEARFPEAGHYAFVDHDMRHAEAGAHGTVRVGK